MSEFRYFESGYFEPFFDVLFELEDEESVEDVLARVMTGSRPVARQRLLRDRAEVEREDEEALIALLLAATR